MQCANDYNYFDIEDSCTYLGCPSAAKVGTKKATCIPSEKLVVRVSPLPDGVTCVSLSRDREIESTVKGYFSPYTIQWSLVAMTANSGEAAADDSSEISIDENSGFFKMVPITKPIITLHGENLSSDTTYELKVTYAGASDSIGYSSITFTSCTRPVIVFTSSKETFNLGVPVKISAIGWPKGKFLDYRIWYEYQVEENGEFLIGVLSESTSSKDLSINYQFPLTMIE